MATNTVAGTATGVPAKNPAAFSEALTKARGKSLDAAGHEIMALAQTLRIARNHKDVHSFEALLTGALMRLELLGTCVAILADSRSDAEEIGIQVSYVTGETVEAGHA